MANQFYYQKDGNQHHCKEVRIVVDEDAGEALCSSCGTVLVQSMVHDGKYDARSFSGSTEPRMERQHNKPFSLTDKILGTEIGTSTKDSGGTPIKSSIRSDMGRLRKLDTRTKLRSSFDRSLKKAMSKIYTVGQKLSLDDSVMEGALKIYGRASKLKLPEGRTIDDISVASLYAESRNRGISRALKEFVVAGNVKRKRLTRTYRMLLKEDRIGLNPKVQDPMSYLAKIDTGDLDSVVRRKYDRLALAIMKEYNKRLSGGKNPIATSVASLYVANLYYDGYLSQKMLERSSGISSVTIRNRGKEIIKTVDLYNNEIFRKIK